MKYRYWIAGWLLLAIMSCNDRNGPSEVTPEAMEEEIRMYFNVPSTYATTVEGESESKIAEVDLLVFKNNAFQYHTSAYKDGNSYRAKLAADNGLTVYFVTNARTLIDSSDKLVQGNNWETDIRPYLILQDAEGLIGSDALPMWGVRENITVEKGKVNQFSNINLLRAVVSVDVFNSANPQTFSLKEAYLYFAPDRGYLAPAAIDYDVAAKSVTAPGSPADMVIRSTPLSVRGVTNEQVVYQLYQYENDSPTDHVTTTRRRSRLVVGASFEGGATTYYPVDYLNEDQTAIEQVMRNYKYVILINSANSEGYPDPDTAAEADDSRLIVSVIDWNLKDENELVFEGPYFISVETKLVYLYKSAGSTNTISFTSNIPAEDLTLEFIDSGNGAQVDAGYKIENDRFSMQLEFNDQTGRPTELTFTALGEYDTNNPSRNLQVVKIYSKRVVMEITIQQLPEDPTAWVDGGSKDITLGED